MLYLPLPSSIACRVSSTLGARTGSVTYFSTQKTHAELQLDRRQR